MDVFTSTDNFVYSKLDKILTEEENDYLYGICELFAEKHKDTIKDSSFFSEGMGETKVHNRNIAFPTEDDRIRFHMIVENINKRLDIIDITSHYPKRENYTWQFNLCISSEEPLFPHTDETEALKKYGIENNMEVSQGIYKGLIYVGNPTIDYAEYGTRFYRNSNRDSEIEEVPFNPMNGCIFKTCLNSWHGTDFKNGLPHNRYFITIQYYEKN